VKKRKVQGVKKAKVPADQRRSRSSASRVQSPQKAHSASGASGMTRAPEAARTFDIEGQEVRCYELDRHRLWRCDCTAFQQRFEKFGEGFCAHTAVAIQRCIADGTIEP
jgi:hypothetical protein